MKEKIINKYELYKLWPYYGRGKTFKEFEEIYLANGWTIIYIDSEASYLEKTNKNWFGFDKSILKLEF